METKRKTLSAADALTIYTGDTMGQIVLKSCFFSGMIYLSVLAIIFITAAIIRVRPSEIPEFSAQIPLLDILFSLASMIYLMVLGLNTYEKNLPGGKFFRSVSFGFEAYKKMRLGVMLEGVLYILTIHGLEAAGDALGILPMVFGTASAVSGTLFSLLAFLTAIILTMINNDMLRYLFVSAAVVLILAGGMLCTTRSGGLGTVHAFAGAADIVLLLVSNRIVLYFYRKYRWDS